eukprot:TRINITY_DN106665_c0_g1_i1.p1 TRINITY_DN106665_c0_g1~~TRINITY_DN106665_c0_g1_i1.p1  ORF type:complete len:176 (+),score=34.53 TRINITY_DN106665_c0_g1_i1:34-528(+)
MGHASCALGCDKRGCAGLGASRPHVVEVEVPADVLTSTSPKPTHRTVAPHHSPLPVLQCDMQPAAVAASFAASAKAEAEAKHRRRLACKAAREAAAAGEVVDVKQQDGTSPEGREPPSSPDDPSRSLLLDGRFVSSGAIRQRLEQMGESPCLPVPKNLPPRLVD